MLNRENDTVECPPQDEGKLSKHPSNHINSHPRNQQVCPGVNSYSLQQSAGTNVGATRSIDASSCIQPNRMLLQILQVEAYPLEVAQQGNGVEQFTLKGICSIQAAKA